jgi:hypothetical protein
MHKLYELKDMLCEELEEYGSKDKLDVGGLDIVDKLSHAIKNLDKIIEKYEEEEYSMRGDSYEGSYERGMSMARGRNARRDSMGRYSREGGSYERRGRSRGSYARGYSRGGEMVMELRDLMEDAPDDRTRMEIQNLITRLEGM